MLETTERNQWMNYFDEFNRRNRWRPTSLLVVGQSTVQKKAGVLPLLGISLETDGDGSTRMHIMVGDHNRWAPSRQTFTITGVRRLKPQCGVDGTVETLEIEDDKGVVNLLRYGPTTLLPAPR